MCSLFATTYPERTRALDHDRHATPSGCGRPTIRGRPTPRRASASSTRSARTGAGRSASRPGRRAAPPIRRSASWWSNYLRQGASPGAALTLTQMNAEIDVRARAAARARPDAGAAPNRRRCLLVEEGRYVAEPGSRRAVRRAARRRPPAVCRRSGRHRRRIATFLVVGSRAAAGSRARHGALRPHRGRLGRRPIAAAFEAHVRQEVGWFRGRGLAFTPEVSSPRSTARREPSPVRARWPPPARVSAAPDASAFTPASATSRPRGESRGVAFERARGVCSRAAAGEVLVSRTVTDLVAGSGLAFVDRGEHPLDRRRALAAVRRCRASFRDHLTLRLPLPRGAAHLEPQRSAVRAAGRLRSRRSRRRRSSAVRRRRSHAGRQRRAVLGRPASTCSGPCAFCSETLTMSSGVMLISLTRWRAPAFQTNTGAVSPLMTTGVAGTSTLGAAGIDAAAADHQHVIGAGS